MRDRFSPPGPILFSLRLLAAGLAVLLALQACSNHTSAAPGQRAGLELRGSIRNWQLGEGYFVVLAVPEVRNRAQAVFPQDFDSASIAADGSFTLVLQHEPRWLLADGSALRQLCPGGVPLATTSFHYLTITQEPVAGELFTDFGLIRPVTADPELLVFFTFLSGFEPAGDCPVHEGWNIINIAQQGEGLAEVSLSQSAELEWQLVR